jgi:hypothetical protein
VKPEDELPVAVHVVDGHGLVTVLRITPAGNAFFRQVSISKGHLRARSQFKEAPEVWNQVKDIRRSRRVFLDETEDEKVPTYCKKGRHQVEIPMGELRQRATAFRGGGASTTLRVS